MEAIIETGGKQFRVAEGDTIAVEKLPAEAGAEVVFDRVLTVNKDGELTVGRPVVAGARVVGKVLEHGKARKIIVFKYKAKKNYRRKQGHRQPLTRVLIEKIEA
jgi:large subunit ribosomal protein L21